MHKEFAEIYDIFMKHVNYSDWYRFLKNYIKGHGSILDLGCGTGEFIYRFLEDGYSVTGIDISEAMLEVSRKKIKAKKLQNNNYKLERGNIINYIHSEKVDYIMCNFDTVNYLKNEKEFIEFMDMSSKNLKKGGILVFDAVTEGIFEEIFENDLFLDEEPEYTSIWRYEQLGKKEHLVEIDLFIRENENDNLFRKYNDKQYKFIYEPSWIIETAQKKGFKIIDTAVNSDFGESRIFFIFKKKRDI